MATESTIIVPVASLLAGIAEGLPFDPPVKAYATPPQVLQGTGPFAVVEFPRLSRRAVLDGETQIGSYDWLPTYPVVLYVDLKVAQRDSDRVIALLETFVHAIDANPGLGDSMVDDSAVEVSEPFIYIEQARPFLAYACEVAVSRLVPTTP